MQTCYITDSHYLRICIISWIYICKRYFLHTLFLLTHYQTTNFRLFQTGRFCRRQFQIWRKWQKVIQTGRKHCGKRRNCSFWAISPFPTVFSKGFLPGASKGGIVWEWVNLYRNRHIREALNAEKCVKNRITLKKKTILLKPYVSPI